MYAQTLVQLVARMRQHQYADGEVTRVAAAHELATNLFSGWYRPSGDPLLAHLVGVASVLVELRRPIDAIVASLLHAAYPNGDFGVVPGGSTPRNRASNPRRVPSDSAKKTASRAASIRNGVVTRYRSIRQASVTHQRRPRTMTHRVSSL